MAGKPVTIQEAATSLWPNPWQLVRDKGKWRQDSWKWVFELWQEGRLAVHQAGTHCSSQQKPCKSPVVQGAWEV